MHSSVSSATLGNINISAQMGTSTYPRNHVGSSQIGPLMDASKPARAQANWQYLLGSLQLKVERWEASASQRRRALERDEQILVCDGLRWFTCWNRRSADSPPENADDWGEASGLAGPPKKPSDYALIIARVEKLEDSGWMTRRWRHERDTVERQRNLFENRLRRIGERSARDLDPRDVETWKARWNDGKLKLEDLGDEERRKLAEIDNRIRTIGVEAAIETARNDVTTDVGTWKTGCFDGEFKMLEDLGDEQERTLAAIYFQCLTGYSKEPLKLREVLADPPGVRFEQIDVSSPEHGSETIEIPVLMKDGKEVVLLRVLDGMDDDILALFYERYLAGRGERPQAERNC